MSINPDVPPNLPDHEERESLYRDLRRVQRALESESVQLHDYSVETSEKETKAGSTGTMSVTVELEGDPEDFI